MVIDDYNLSFHLIIIKAQLNTSERQIIQFQQDNRLLEDDLREQKSIVVRLQATIEKLQSSSFPSKKSYKSILFDQIILI